MAAAIVSTNVTDGAVLSNQMFSSGGTASFATNVMTLKSVPTSGSVQLDQVVTAVGVAAGTTIDTLLSGTLNAINSTYGLSTTPGTIATEAMSSMYGTINEWHNATNVSVSIGQLIYVVSTVENSLDYDCRIFDSEGNDYFQYFQNQVQPGDAQNCWIAISKTTVANLVLTIYTNNTNPTNLVIRVISGSNSSGIGNAVDQYAWLTPEGSATLGPHINTLPTTVNSNDLIVTDWAQDTNGQSSPFWIDNSGYTSDYDTQFYAGFHKNVSALGTYNQSVTAATNVIVASGVMAAFTDAPVNTGVFLRRSYGARFHHYINEPISVTAGDLIIVAYSSCSAANPATISDGINTYKSFSTNGIQVPGYCTGYIFYAVAATTTTTLSITITNSAEYAGSMFVHIVAGCISDVNTVLDVSSVLQESTSTNTHTANSVTTTTKNSYLFSFWFQDYGGFRGIQSTGFKIQRAMSSNGYRVWNFVSDKVSNAIGTYQDSMLIEETEIFGNITIAFKGINTSSYDATKMMLCA